MPEPQTFQRARLYAFAFVVGMSLCFAGILPAAEPAGPAPASFIHDETRLLDEKSSQQLSQSLQEAHEKLGVSLYVAAYPYLTGISVRDRALALADQWSGEEPGMAIALNRGDGQAGIAASAGLWRRYPPDEAVLVLSDATALLLKSGLSPEERVTQAAHLVLERVGKMEDIRQSRAQTLNHSELRLAGIFAAALMALGVIVWFGLILWRRHEAARSALFFPDVEVSTRLGAPFGGGVIGIAGEED